MATKDNSIITPSSVADTPRAVLEVQQRLAELMEKYKGRNGRDDEARGYIPYFELKKLWTLQRFNRVLNPGSTLTRYTHNQITTNFLGVLSLLTWVNSVNYLNHFTERSLEDNSFPLREFPWPKGMTYLRQLYDTVRQYQWIFFPFAFIQGRLYSQCLEPDCIIPVSDEVIIKQGDFATVSIIKTSQAFGGSGEMTLIRKTYRDRDRSRSHYERELQAFASLEIHSCPHIVKCYGGYAQRRADNSTTFNLILEYVDGREYGNNLEEMFQNVPRPQTLEEVSLFWTAFIGLFKALALLHQSTGPGNHRFLAIHQDIKPENILVSRHPSGGPYRFSLKIADFGFTHTQAIEGQDFDPPGIDSHGGPTYGAPECSHHARYDRRGWSYITTAADVWSMGCVISDAAVWVAGGEEARQNYRQRRSEETRTHKSFAGSGHEGCFHDGIQALRAVEEAHDMIGKVALPFDAITRQVVGMVQKHMLLRQNERWSAKELHEELTTITSATGEIGEQSRAPPDTPIRVPEIFTEDTTDGSKPLPIKIPSPESFSPPYNPFESRSPVSPLTRPRSHMLPIANDLTEQKLALGSLGAANFKTRTASSADPVLTIKDAHAYRIAKKGSRQVDRRVESIISDLKSNLGMRDHIFFIDVSRTMHDHLKVVMEAFQDIAYIAKEIDTDGIELCFSSDPKKMHKSYWKSDTSSLVKHFNNQKWNQIAFEDRLGSFIDIHVIPRLRSWIEKFWKSKVSKQLSVYIFTDGKWGTDKTAAGGVEKPIDRLIKAIDKMEVDRNKVMLQFIRFGDDEDGKAYLSYLDNYGKKVNMYDIVDTKPINGNLYEMFFGSIHADMDSKGEEDSIQIKVHHPSFDEAGL